MLESLLSRDTSSPLDLVNLAFCLNLLSSLSLQLLQGLLFFAAIAVHVRMAGMMAVEVLCSYCSPKRRQCDIYSGF